MDIEDIFNSSYEKNILKQGDYFFDRFYVNFMARSEQIRALFNATDMERQKYMLMDSLAYMLSYAATGESGGALDRLAQLHRRLEIKDEHYDFWLESLLQTLSELDHQFGEQEAMAWRMMMGPGLQFMKGKPAYSQS